MKRPTRAAPTSERLSTDVGSALQAGARAAGSRLTAPGSSPPQERRPRPRSAVAAPSASAPRTAEGSGPGTGLVSRAAEDRDARVAGIGGVGAGALAEREGRASGVGDEPLMAAAVAEAGRLALHEGSMARPRQPPSGGEPLQSAFTSLCIVVAMGTFRRLLGFLRPHRRALWGSLVFAWLAMGMTVLIPWLVGGAV